MTTIRLVPLVQQTNQGQCHHSLEVSRSHTMTHDTQWNFSCRGIGLWQRYVSDKISSCAMLFMCAYVTDNDKAVSKGNQHVTVDRTLIPGANTSIPLYVETSGIFV
jgi:hypothetical protein